MKIIILATVFSCICVYSKAQDYAVIKDKDGFVNVRKEPNAKSEIIGKLYVDDIFSYDTESESAGWIEIYKEDIKKDNDIVEGYIDKTRLFPLSKLRSLGRKFIGNHSVSIKNDSISIAINASAFHAKSHKLHYDGQNELTSIDGKHIWGTDGNIPKVKITGVNVSINNTTVIIPKSEFGDLYEPNFKLFHAYLSKNGTIYIEMDNSDGAGAYTIIWVIKDNKYLKRYIDNGNA